MVLLDVNMPRMSGIEFLKALRQDPELQSTPVVMFTTSDEGRDRAQAYELHVAGYHVKPAKFSVLVELLATLDRYWSLAEMP
jgi:CheY-like chemotaxis protein